MKLHQLLCFLSLTACAPPKGRLVVYGDSISAGSYTKSSYATLLANACGLREENHSVSSTTLAEDAQIGSVRRSHPKKGDRVLFSPGVNDALQHGHDPAYLDTYRALLAETLDHFEASGAEAYVGEPLLALADNAETPDLAKQLGTLNNDSALYARELRQLIQEKGYQRVHLVETRAKFHPEPALMHDHVHPGDGGHRALFGIFREAMPDCSNSERTPAAAGPIRPF